MRVGAQVGRALQKDKRHEVEKTTERANGASDEAEEGREEGKTPVHRLQHLVDEQGRADVKRGRDEKGRGPGAKQRLVRQEIRRGGRGIVLHHKLADQNQGIDAGEKAHQPAKPAYPGFDEGRHR